MASPGRQEEMIDSFKDRSGSSVRRSCRVLGLRRQTYYRRKQGFRVEERDKEVVDILHRVTKRFIAWGFWISFTTFGVMVTLGIISGCIVYGNRKS